MTYLEYLLLFIIFPFCLLVSLSIHRRKISMSSSFITNFGTPFIILAFIALFYTTPWDNYLVAQGIWSYDPSKVLGIVLGFVPIEEYSFFILETLLVSFIFFISFNDLFNRELIDFFPTKASAKYVVLTSITIIWFLCLITFLLQFKTLMYLNLLLLWSIPPIFIQLFIGWEIIWYYKRKIFLIVLIVGSYLSITDAYAIYTGIWSINKNFITGISVLFMPLEEILFFFITTLLIVLGFANIYYVRYKYMTESKIIQKTRSSSNPVMISK